MPSRSRIWRNLCVFCLAVSFSLAAHAQGHGPGGPGSPGGPGGGMGHGPMPGAGGMNHAPETHLPDTHASDAAGVRNGTIAGPVRSGVQIGPPGRWWDDSGYARSIGLDRLQQQRMDNVFSANRDSLLSSFKNLQQQQSTLEKLTRASRVDEAQVLAQIDRVTQARGELEKANARMQLQIRKELTPEQVTRLEGRSATQQP